MKTGLEVFWSSIADELNPPPAKKEEPKPDSAKRPPLNLPYVRVEREWPDNLPSMRVEREWPDNPPSVRDAREWPGWPGWSDDILDSMRNAPMPPVQAVPSDIERVHVRCAVTEESAKALPAAAVRDMVRQRLAHQLATQLEPMMSVGCKSDPALNCTIYYAELDVLRPGRNEERFRRWFRAPTN